MHAQCEESCKCWTMLVLTDLFSLLPLMVYPRLWFVCYAQHSNHAPLCDLYEAPNCILSMQLNEQTAWYGYANIILTWWVKGRLVCARYWCVCCGPHNTFSHQASYVPPICNIDSLLHNTGMSSDSTRRDLILTN